MVMILSVLSCSENGMGLDFQGFGIYSVKVMKIIPLLFILLLIPSLTLTALQADPGPVLEKGDVFGITIAPVYTLLNGRSTELVLYSGSYDNTYTSKLTWDLNTVQMMGGKVSLNLHNVLFINFAVTTALTRDTGEMHDFDWLYSNYKNPDLTSWTNWSESDISLQSSYQLDYNTTVRFYRTYNRSFDILAGFKLIHWSWTDILTDIDYPYIPNNRDEPVDHSSIIGENGIDYDVYYRIPYLGSSFTWTRGPFQAGMTLLYSWMVNVDDHDHHFYPGSTTERHFYDYYENGQYLSLSILSKFSFSDFMALSLSYDWEEVFEMQGDSIIVTKKNWVSTTSYDPDSVAVAYYAATLSLALEFSF